MSRNLEGVKNEEPKASCKRRNQGGPTPTLNLEMIIRWIGAPGSQALCQGPGLVSGGLEQQAGVEVRRMPAVLMKRSYFVYLLVRNGTDWSSSTTPDPVRTIQAFR